MIEAVGRDVAAFSVGERLFGYCDGPFGAHAQYLAVPEDNSVTTIRNSTSYAEAAPSTEGAHYALAADHTRQCHPCPSPLFPDAAGGEGSDRATQHVSGWRLSFTQIMRTAFGRRARRNLDDHPVGLRRHHGEVGAAEGQRARRRPGCTRDKARS